MSEKKIVKTYDYTDLQGNLIFQVVRTEPKGFFQRRPCNGGFACGLCEGWYEQKSPGGNYTFVSDAPNDNDDIPPSHNPVWLDRVEPILYRLRQVMEGIKNGQTVYIVEGEKDADNLAVIGFISTTCPMGAGKWKISYTQTLTGRKEVVIIADKDDPGRKHALDIAKHLIEIGIKVKIIEMPDINNTPTKDFSDWLEAGGQKSQFEELVQNTPHQETTESSAANTELQELIKLYGEPYYEGKNGKVGSINEIFWAGMYNYEHTLLFAPKENTFYLYNAETGVREAISVDRIKRDIASRILEISREQNIPSLEIKRYNTCLNNIIAQLMGISERPDAFNKKGQKFVHLKNGIIVFDEHNKADLVSFSPEFYSRNQCPISYDKDAKCPRFLNELLLPAVSAADAIIIQKYAGLCLFGQNLIQRLLILDGAAGRGKTQLALIIQYLIGRTNFTELRTKHLSERFELYRYLKRTLLVGVDVPGDFLSEKGAYIIKGLVGGDLFDAEQKGGTGSFQFEGNFCMIITANSRLRIRLDSDAGAWQRRLLIIRFECAPPPKKISNFAELLIKEEGPGILNWALEGLAMLFDDNKKHGDICLSDGQTSIVKNLLAESDSVRHFLKDMVVKDPSSSLTTLEIIYAYSEYCADKGWNPKPPTVIPKELEKYMLELFSVPKSGSILRDGKEHKGYRKVRLKDVGHQ